jgi:hypothetical protein
MKQILIALILMAMLPSCSRTHIINLSDHGIIPNTEEDMSPLIAKALKEIKATIDVKDKVVMNFDPGSYHFHSTDATVREYYISNHDQWNPKNVGIALEGWNNLTINGHGSSFIFHGTMLPVALLRSDNTVLKNFSIDFENPHIAQVQIIANEGENGITAQIAPWVHYRISDEQRFETIGEGWVERQMSGIAFEEKTKRIVYRTSDLSINTNGVTELEPYILHFPNWRSSQLIPGTVVAMRSWNRPTPGIFLSHNKNTVLNQVTVHYSQGMALLAQLCENITLDGFNVSLKGDDDPRYFTAQADATHFSSCKGKIISVNGLYENMMDDAINVHGTYLKVIERIDDYTLVGRYMHSQAWGFDWGFAGDIVSFVKSRTMDILPGENEIASIEPKDKKTVDGAREFIIQFKKPVDPAINAEDAFGIENLTWTPEVYFANNIIRNNRARGTLFSTPKKTVIENNLFDHTSGTAILLCGDCNGWFETGACRNVIIRNNRFVNSLTSMFQFTNAIISIYPEIPDLENQTGYFHGGKKGAITIVDNVFETFDNPILYAKSVNGLVFKNNTIIKTNDFEPFHWNKERFLLERVINAEIEE